MKQFLTNIFCFLSIVFVLAVCADICVSHTLRHSKNQMYVGWNDIYNDTTHYDLVINGNSRALQHFNPYILDSLLLINTYNLGMNGSMINRQIIKYDKYCELHGEPKYLLQNIDLFTMASTMGYEREQFFPYFFYDRDLMQTVDKFEHFTFAEKYLPYCRYMGIDIRPQDDGLYKGYKGKDNPWNGTDFLEQKNIALEKDSLMLRMFDNFLEKQIQTGIHIIFVYSPMYHGVIDKCPNMNKMYNMYDSIASKYDIPILNYFEMPICYDTTYFYNAIHLNRIGAEIFTTHLAQDVDSIMLTQ